MTGPFTGRGNRQAQHGTNSGYQAHISYGEKPCDECSKAHAEYAREYRRRRHNSNSKTDLSTQLGDGDK